MWLGTMSKGFVLILTFTASVIGLDGCQGEEQSRYFPICSDDELTANVPNQVFPF